MTLARQRRVADQLEQLYVEDVLDTASIACVAGASARSVARWRAGRGAPREGAAGRVGELYDVVDLARRVLPRGAARYWLRSPNPSLGYEKPLDLIADGQSQRVVGILLGLAEGLTA